MLLCSNETRYQPLHNFRNLQKRQQTVHVTLNVIQIQSVKCLICIAIFKMKISKKVTLKTTWCESNDKLTIYKYSVLLGCNFWCSCCTVFLCNISCKTNTYQPTTSTSKTNTKNKKHKDNWNNKTKRHPTNFKHSRTSTFKYKKEMTRKFFKKKNEMKTNHLLVAYIIVLHFHFVIILVQQ